MLTKDEEKMFLMRDKEYGDDPENYYEVMIVIDFGKW